jgi:hypothetical protein
VAGLLRLLRKDAARKDQGVFPGALATLADWVDGALLAGQWETLAAISVVVLETLHASRPWHTGVLAIAVVCYLLAVHEAESPVPGTVLRSQPKVLLASLALLVVATGVAIVPSARTGALPVWLEVLAALAAMTAAGLALPL